MATEPISTSHSGFPSDFVSFETKKSPEFIRQFLRAMYQAKQKNVSFFERENDRIINNRKYAEGLQSIEKYKNWFNDEGDTSYLNLDYSAIPIVKKFVNIRVGEMLNMDYKIYCRSTDVKSLTEKDTERNKFLANMKLKEFSDMLKEETGVPIIPENEYVPQDTEELEIHLDFNFKLGTEIATEKLIDFTFAYNDWKRERKHIIRDLVVIKKCAVRLYYDENSRVRLRYTDWANIITPFVVKDNFSDAKYAGEVIKMPLHEIRRMDINNDLSEEDLFEIAKRFAGKFDNPSWDNRATSFHQYFNTNGKTNAGYDDFLVPVLDGEFISLNVEKWEEKPNSKGGFFYNRKSSDYQTEDKSRKVTAKELEYLYKGKWIVDTDYLFDFGMAKDIMRTKKNGKISPETKLNFLMLAPDIIDMQNKAMVEDIIPQADQMQLVGLKIQHLVAKLVPPGMAVDVNALKDVFLGKGENAWAPLEIQDLYQHLGTYYYNGADLNGMPMNRKPIEEIKQNIGTVLTELVNTYNFYLQQIRDMSGINEMRDASTPSADQGLGVSKMALGSSRNATRAIDYAFVEIFEMTATRMAEMLQYNIMRGRNIEEYKNAIGSIDVDTLKVLDEIPLRDLGIFVEAKIEGDERMLLEQNIQMEITQKTLGTEDAIMIRSILNTKQANRYLIYRKKKRMEEQMMIAQKNAQDNAMVQQQSAAAKAQMEQQVIQAEVQGDITKKENEYKLKDWLEERNFERKQKELRLISDLKLGEMHTSYDRDFQQAALDKVGEKRVA